MVGNSYITSTLQQKPSIFEVFAAEMLDNTCFPAFYRFFKFLDDEHLLHVKSEVISSGVLGILQFFYLRKYDASFGESFYGLQRTNWRNPNTSLSTKKKIISVVCMVLPKYLGLTCNLKIPGKSLLTRSLSSIILVYNLMKAMQSIGYMMKIFGTHSPILGILRIQLNYLSKPIDGESVTFIIFKLFEVFTFFLQFTQWWYENNRYQNLYSLQSRPSELKTKLIVELNACPICLQTFDTPVASVTTGLVYCWKCIANRIRVDICCPVTNVPTNLMDLIRVYES